MVSVSPFWKHRGGKRLWVTGVVARVDHWSNSLPPAVLPTYRVSTTGLNASPSLAYIGHFSEIDAEHCRVTRFTTRIIPVATSNGKSTMRSCVPAFTV